MQQSISKKLVMLFAVVGTVLSLMIAPQLAQAHDVLTDSTPEIDSTVETTPTEVRLQFSGQPLTGEGLTNLIRVTDDQGNQWQDGEVSVEGFDIAIPVCEDLPQGDYTVAYRVVYSDGHTGEESFGFTNADPSAPEEGTPQDCGEPASDTETEPTTPSDNDPEATSDADPTADENASTSIPVWVWIAGGLGVVLVGAIVFLLLRGTRTGASEDPADD